MAIISPSAIWAIRLCASSTPLKKSAMPTRPIRLNLSSRIICAAPRKPPSRLVTALADGPRPPANIALRERDGGKKELVWEPVEDATGYIIALRPAGSLIYADQLPISETKVVWAGFSRITPGSRSPPGILAG